jgi:hypothetical protein
MPPLLAALPLIAAIGGLAGTGVGLGLELSNKPGAPKTVPETPAQIGTNQNQIKAAVSQEDPNILAQTSGLANPDYVAQISQLLAGTGGQTGSTGAARDAAAQAFGLPSISGGGGTGPVRPPATPGSQQFVPAGQSPSADSQTPVQLSDFVNRFIFGGA